ncbi:MAG TPA: hypothetical protein VKQ27_20235 [Acetobacteraceae bacterium]|nr:hypothetical protein [Acetobacteraceae bacterium]
MLIDEVDAAASTVEHANAGENFAAALDDAKTTHPDTSPPSHPGHSGGGGILGGLWHDAVSAVSGVSSAYNTVNGAMHSAGHALDNVAQSGISLGTGLVRDIAGNGAANVFHGAAEGLRQSAKDTAGFAYGLGEGGIEALGGMAKGVGDLVGDSYRFATDGNFRGSVVHGAESVVTHVAQDPIGSAKALSSGLLHAGENWVRGAGQAAVSGDLGEYVGKGAGNLAVNVGGFFIPGADAADAVSLAGKAGEAAEGLNLASKAGDAANALGDAEKAGELGNAGRAGETTEASGTIDLGRTNADPLKPAADPLAEPVRSAKTFSSFEEFEAASNHPAPNTSYRLGDYEWSTDAQGRTIEAGGTVKVQEFGRNNPSLQQEIGHEGRSTDVGFHLIADSLDGPTVRLNGVFDESSQGRFDKYLDTYRAERAAL